MDSRQQLSAAGGVAALLTGLIAILCRWRRRRCCDASVGGWDQTPTWGENGKMTNVGAFASFVDASNPCWRHYAVSSALAVLGIDPGSDAPIEPVGLERHPSAGSGEVDVILTYEIEGDDSVAGTRYRFTFVDEAFTGGTPGVLRLIDGLRQIRCQPGRGQTDWGTDLCL